MPLPTDGHVHSEWSWDAQHGSMERTCARAVQVGLPAIAFTEHLDHTVWRIDEEDLAQIPAGHPVAVNADGGRMVPPPLDVEGYLAEVDRCRTLFPDLRVLTGLELGEPHWHADAVAEVLRHGDEAGGFDRLIGSLHCLPDEGGYREPDGLYGHRDPSEVVRTYLAEVAVLVEDEAFTVLGHVDYPVRSWPDTAGPFDLTAFEDELRHTLRTAAAAGKSLEINTVVPLAAQVVRWFREEGGESVTFGSDAHEPERVARGLVDAAALAEASGFRPGRDPFQPWGRA
jgi:histidinol-phosphatase (PHP family)